MLLGPRSRPGRSVGPWHQCECSNMETGDDIIRGMMMNNDVEDEKDVQKLVISMN